jgi:pimeloyl-ACP methyl ester carboxylesterase
MNRLHSILVPLLTFVLVLAGCDGSNNNNSSPPEPEIGPIVFVHGQSGSAQQFETHAMRFTSNGYPQDQLFAFEYDTGVQENPIAALDAFIDAVLETTGAAQVYAVGHSRGTTIWTTYLDDPQFDGPDKVARYVNIDGRSQEQLPGGVPTLGIWGEWNSADSGFNRREDNSNAQIGPDPAANHYFPDKSHTETATSAEAFALMYEFLTGIAPTTTAVTEASGPVDIAGRVVLFPENLGYDGGRVQVWELEAATGQRRGAAPVSEFTVDASGDFGPLELNTDTHYEFALLREATEEFPVPSVHHFYSEPFVHDNYFLRLQTSKPGQSLEAFLPRWEDSTGMVVLRQKEFWGDQGAMSDELFVDGVNVLQPQISPRSRVNLALFLHDEGGDNTTDLEKGEIFPFNLVTFLTGADVFIPATPVASGSIELVLVTRGGGETRLHLPNWPSDANRVSVMFRDDTD